MSSSDLIQSIIAMLTPVLLLYLFMFILFYSRRFIRDYNRNRMLRFTQEAVKELLSEIKLVNEHYDLNTGATVQSLISRFNEVAVGINEGLYNETYVRMVLGYEMMSFYREYRKSSKEYLSDKDNMFLPLELLLKKWDEEKFSYRILDNWRYL